MSYGRIIDAVINNPPAGTGAQLVVPEHTYKAGVQYRNNFMDGQLTLNADVYHLDGTPTPQAPTSMKCRPTRGMTSGLLTITTSTVSVFTAPSSPTDTVPRWLTVQMSVW